MKAKQPVGKSDSHGQKDQAKMADSKQIKRKGKKDINTEISVNVDTSEAVDNNNDEYRSPMLFCDDNQVKKKRKITKKLGQKVKRKLPQAQSKHLSDTSTVSESQENAEGFIIEETNGQIVPRNMIHLEERSDQSELDTHTCLSRSVGRKNADLLDDVLSGQDKFDACSSIEIPRDVIQSSALCLGSFIQKPSFLLESSDEDSLIDSGRGKNCNLLAISSSKSDPLSSIGNKVTNGSSSQTRSDNTYSYVHTDAKPDSLSSFGSKVTNGSFSQMGSDYSYSYVSTYTDATGTVSTKTITASPPVKMKVCQNRNSTVCPGKDCIGDIEFPQSISPVVKHKAHLLPQANYVEQECAFRIDSMESLRIKGKKKIHTPKCSTVLFGSENTCSLPKISDNLTAIHSNEMGKNSETQIEISDRLPSTKHSPPQTPATHQDNVISTQCGLKTFHRSKQKGLVNVSTPLGLAKTLSLDISPIEHTIMDDDELQIHNSSVAYSDEIFVPSPPEPGSHDRLVTAHKNDGSAAHSHGHKEQESTEMFISGHARRDDPSQHSYSKHSSGTDNKAMNEKSDPPNIATSIRATRNMEAVNTSGIQNIWSQVEMTPNSKDREIQAKMGKSHKKTPCASLHENMHELAHTKECGVANKDKMLIEQSSESPYQMTNMSVTDRRQHVQQVNSMSNKTCGTFSQQSGHFPPKRQYKKGSSNRYKIQRASTVCYINRLCMASQEYFRTAHKLHQ